MDVETEGLDVGRCRIIELAIQRFQYDARAHIVQTFPPIGWFEDPGRPLATTIKEITNLTDADLAGRAIPDGTAYGLIAYADVVIAHNARFDRPFVEKRLDEMSVPWVVPSTMSTVTAQGSKEERYPLCLQTEASFTPRTGRRPM